MTTALTKPFLLLSTRPEDDMAEQELQSFIRLMGLGPGDVVQRRVNLAPLGPVDFDDYSGILIGGSPFNSTDEDKTDQQLRVEQCLSAVIDEALQRDFPTFGACYGVGIIGTAAGGTVCRTYGEPAACIEVTKTDDGVQEPLLDGIDTTFPALVGHKEACSQLPEGATLLATGKACPVQMFRVGRNVFVTQFHPELEYDSFRNRLITYENAGYFEPGTIDDILASCEGHDLSIPPRILDNFARRYGR